MNEIVRPAVSVIIPVYNVEKYLEECLDSVLSQTLRNIEVICVDDGSTDNSPVILEQYVQKDRRIRVLFQKNQHAGVARNRGLAEAQGDYVIFLDSDDFFHPEMLEKTTHVAKEHNADIVLFGGMRYDDATQTVTKNWDFLRRDLLPAKPVFSPADAPNVLFTISNPAPWSKLYSRQFLLETGLQFQALPNSNDIYFTICSMALAERITAVDLALISYRINRTASLQQDKHREPLCFLTALNGIYQELLQRELFGMLKIAFQRCCLGVILYNLRSIQSDKGRLLILDALDNEPYCKLPLQEDLQAGSENDALHRCALQLAAARNWYHLSERLSTPIKNSYTEPKNANSIINSGQTVRKMKDIDISD